jgi:periplasmic protein TonB
MLLRPPAEPTPAPGKDQTDIAGTQQQQQAQSIEARPLSREKLGEYVKGLSDKIKSNRSHERIGRRASAVVAFTILKDGNIRPETLKIVKSTGQPKLDAYAMQQIRASVPFDPPPEPFSIAVTVDFDR